MNENNQAQNQAKNQQGNQAAAKAAEAKTVLNGQEVDVKQAQAAEEAFNRQNNQTGIQAHHDNSSEAVEAGQVAQNSAAAQNMQQHKAAAVKPANVQSGQQHLSQHLQAGSQNQSQAEQIAKEDHQTIQSTIDAKTAKAKTKKAD